MKRTSKRSGIPDVRPVQRIDLSQKHTGLRIAAAGICIILAVAAIGYGVSGLISRKSGWTKIEPAVVPEENCCQELIFQYDLGADGISPSLEHKKISKIYTDACGAAHRLLNAYEEYADCKNVRYLNEHPNEVVTVEEPLYNSFLLLDENQSRLLYMAPIYEQYNALFSCMSDEEAQDFDPVYNQEVKAFIDETLKFVQDEHSVSLKLLGNNQVELAVSDEYIEYAKEQYIGAFIDFFWLKNAFVVDYAAQVLNAEGYTHGIITSYDGFSRHLGEVEIPLSYNIFDKAQGNERIAARIPREDKMNIVCMRGYMKHDLDVMHYYQWENGDTRGPYIDPRDGKAKSSLLNLVGYSKQKSCAKIALDLFDLYASDNFDKNTERKVIQKGIDLIYCKNNVLYYSNEVLQLSDLYKNDTVSYEKKLIK